MESLEFVFICHRDVPIFRTVYQSWNDDGTINSGFRVVGDITVFENWLPESPKSFPCFYYPVDDIVPVLRDWSIMEPR